MYKLHLLLNLFLLFSSLIVITCNKSVECIVFLLLTFFFSSSLLFLYEVEFLSIIFILVYGGALVILFLFVLMMSGLKNFSNFSNYFRYFKESFFGLSLLYIILLVFYNYLLSYFLGEFVDVKVSSKVIVDDFGDIDILGQVLFNDYYLLFLISGFVLLIALVGAILLTLNFSSIKSNKSISRLFSRTNKYVLFDMKKKE
jgi:NADH-quinone oxidoreductase subunit J